jgi:hypothetical protein
MTRHPNLVGRPIISRGNTSITLENGVQTPFKNGALPEKPNE